MSNNNVNSVYTWRERVAALECIPGEPMPDKELQWKKLEQRLHKKTIPSRKQYFVYWAAACLFIMVLLPGILRDNKQAELIKKSGINQVTIVKETHSNVETKINPSDKIKPTERLIKKENVFVIKTTDKNIQKLLRPVPVRIETNNSVPKLLTNIAAPFRNMSNIPESELAGTKILPTIEKKKLTVVHNNELAAPSKPFFNNSQYRRYIKSPGTDLSRIPIPAGVIDRDHILFKNTN